MTGTLAPQKNAKLSKPPAQVTNEDNTVFEKEEHKLIYRVFLDTLENPERQTEQEKQKLKEKLSVEEKEELQLNLQSLTKLLGQLQDQNEEKIFTFIFEHSKEIFHNVNPQVKSLSEENFSQFLLSVFKGIREKKLVSEENLENGEIKQLVDDYIADIRGTEAGDSLKKLIGLPFGIKIDPKNISGSFMSGLKEKIPFLGKDKKEEDEPPLSDEEMAKTFLRKSLLPIMLFAFSTLIFSAGPMLLITVIALGITEIKVVKGLFSNDRKGTLYNPHSQEDEKKKEQWNGEILEGIGNILKTEVKGKEEESTAISEQIAQGNKRDEQEPHSKVEQPAANRAETLQRSR